MTEELFGGGIFSRADESDSKTWASRMEEMIANSKKEKHLKKVEKSKQEEATQALDKDFKDLLDQKLIAVKKKKEVTEGKELPKDDFHDFNLLCNQFRLEGRVQATDRMKSEEELALEQKEELEKNEVSYLSVPQICTCCSHLLPVTCYLSILIRCEWKLFSGCVKV